MLIFFLRTPSTSMHAEHINTCGNEKVGGGTRNTQKQETITWVSAKCQNKVELQRNAHTCDVHAPAFVSRWNRRQILLRSKNRLMLNINVFMFQQTKMGQYVTRCANVFNYSRRVSGEDRCTRFDSWAQQKTP